MNKERRHMILNEIDQWRRNKLLPDQYCDFLMNLYSDPDELNQPRSSQQPSVVGKAFSTIQKATGKQWLITFGSFMLISIVVLYFSRFHPVLQISTLGLAVLLFLRIGKGLLKRNESAGLSSIGLGMLTLLGGSLHMLELHSLHHWGWKVLLISFCALFWVVYGIIMRIHMIHLCGWLAALLVYGWMLTEFAPMPNGYEVQLYWLPLAIVFGWSSWFIHRWSRPISSVLFIICAIIWFVPELYMALFMKDMAWLQLQMIIKIAVGGALLFSMRKQWMVWVTE